MAVDRLNATFARLKEEGRAGLGVYITAGDPDLETSAKIMEGLPDAGVDTIEFGMPFSDPMADGPAIQAASLRSLNAGGSLARTLDMVRSFRKKNDTTPIVLMGYFNPVYIYGVDRFLADALEAGVDGLIIVDTPPEQDFEMAVPAIEAGLGFVHLAAPTTSDERLPAVLKNTTGFLYYVSITGITGTKDVPTGPVSEAVARIRKHTDLPIAVGFGIKTSEHAKAIAGVADMAIVGSAVVSVIADSLDEAEKPAPDTAERVLAFVGSLAEGVRAAGS